MYYFMDDDDFDDASLLFACECSTHPSTTHTAATPTCKLPVDGTHWHLKEVGA
jgi:hypothetical protein